VITSTRHPLVQTFRRLDARAHRDSDRRILLDGPRLIAEALDAGVAIEAALVEAGSSPERVAVLVGRLKAAGAAVHDATPRVVQAAGSVVTSQGIVAIARRPVPIDETLLDRRELVLLVADGVQDPGNMGTMVRTAVAAGAAAVALTGGSADPFLPKGLRASMGAAFRIPIVWAEGAVLRSRLAGRGVAVFVADPRGSIDYTAAPLDPPLAIVIGNESTGPDPAWTPIGTGVRIPLMGPVESLNAAVAAALLLYEVARRRKAAPHGR
jgi:TrmH family RNA methyltransferase